MSKKKKNEKEKIRTANKALSPPTSFNQKQIRIIILLLFIFSFLLYGNTLKHEFALDDDVVFKMNKFVQQGIGSIPDIFSNGFLYGFNGVNDQSYRPVVLTVYAIEKEIFGNNPSALHFFNVLFFALCCVFTFLTLNKFFNDAFFFPFLITLLFTAHAIHTEVVANIKGLDEILSYLFIILTFYYLQVYLGGRNFRPLVQSSLCYLFSLLSKENGVVFILIIPLSLHFFSSLNMKKIIYTCMPFVFVFILYMIIRSAALDNITFAEKMSIMNNGIMAAKSESEKVATCFVILWKYLSLLFFPHPLSFDYSYAQIPISNWTNLTVIASLIIYLGLGAYSFFGVIKKDPISFGILFYLIPLSLVSNIFIEIGSTLGERFLFTPSLGFCMAFVLVLFKLFNQDIRGAKSFSRINFGTKGIKIISLILGIVIAGLSYKTIARNADWKNNFTLFTADVENAPNSSRTHFAMGCEFRVKGETEQEPEKKIILLKKGIDEYKKCIKIHPGFEDAWYNMGYSYYLLNEHDSAKFAYEKELETVPGDSKTLLNLGMICFRKNDYDGALKYFGETINRNPSYGDAYTNIGAIYHNRGEYDKALSYYEKALKLNANPSTLYNNLSKIYYQLGDSTKGDSYYKKIKQSSR